MNTDKTSYRFCYFPSKIKEEVYKKTLDRFLKKLIKKTHKEKGIFSIHFRRELKTYIVKGKTEIRNDHFTEDLYQFARKVNKSVRFRREKLYLLDYENRKVLNLRQNKSRKCKKNNLLCINID